MFRGCVRRRKKQQKPTCKLPKTLNFINQFNLFSLNTLSIIYIKTLSCPSNNRIHTSIRTTNKT